MKTRLAVNPPFAPRRQHGRSHVPPRMRISMGCPLPAAVHIWMGTPQLAPGPPSSPQPCQREEGARWRRCQRAAASCSLRFIAAGPSAEGRSRPTFRSGVAPSGSREGEEGAAALRTCSKWPFSEPMGRKEPERVGASSQLRARARASPQRLCAFPRARARSQRRESAAAGCTG